MRTYLGISVMNELAADIGGGGGGGGIGLGQTRGTSLRSEGPR